MRNAKVYRSKKLPSLQERVAESCAFLKKHEPKEGYSLGFSGGKDSVALLWLAKQAGVRFQAFYSCTRIDPPEVMRFIRSAYPEVRWISSRTPYWTLLRKNGPPTRARRWCCYKLKHEPAKKVRLPHRLVGVRGEESSRRAHQKRISKEGSQTLYYPIFHWDETLVWELIDRENLPYCSLYDEGFSRIGCICCPLWFGDSQWAQNRLALYQSRWPATWRIFEKIVKEWFSTKMADGLWVSQKLRTPEDYWSAYTRGLTK